MSQAPREAPARRAPSSAFYLEEKSDQQKKEEVGVREEWLYDGHRVPLVVVVFQFSSMTQIGTGASVTPLSVGELNGETFQSPAADRCHPQGTGHGTQEAREGKREAPPWPGSTHLELEVLHPSAFGTLVHI